MKKFLFAFFACAVFAFSGCSEDDGGGSASEPGYDTMPIAMYASFTSAQRSDYEILLESVTYGFEEEGGVYEKYTTSTYLSASFTQTGTDTHCLLLAYYGYGSFPSSLFPNLTSYSRVAYGESRFYEGNASAYFESQRNWHIEQVDHPYTIEGDSDAYTYCREMGSEMRCWEYDVDEDDYFLTIYNMEKSYFDSVFANIYG